MATVIVMPALGNSVESCLIVSWSVTEGDTIAENGILCEVETDKASMEVPSTASGTVLKLLWEEGDDVPVMQPLLVVGEPGEDPAPALADVGFSAAAEAPVAPAATAAAAPADGAYGSSPRARNLAAAEGIDIAAVPAGTGPGGRVIARDVAAVADGTTKAAARAGAVAGEGTGLGGRVSQADLTAPAAPVEEASAPTTAPAAAADSGFPGPYTETPLKGIRKVISERMMHSLASSAQLTYTTTARAQGLLEMRKRLKNSDPVLGMNKVTIGDLVGFAAVKTAARHPAHNAHLVDGVLTTFERVHLGFACDTPRGLLVPTIRDASRLSLGQFSAISKDLAAQAIDGNINPDLLSGATFTVSNLGGFGIESFTPLLNVPQTAILGVDAIFPRAYTDEDGQVRTEQRIGLSLTADHRVIDGADAARFLKDLVAFLENIEIAVLS